MLSDTGRGFPPFRLGRAQESLRSSALQRFQEGAPYYREGHLLHGVKPQESGPSTKAIESRVGKTREVFWRFPFLSSFKEELATKTRFFRVNRPLFFSRLKLWIYCL